MPVNSRLISLKLSNQLLEKSFQEKTKVERTFIFIHNLYHVGYYNNFHSHPKTLHESHNNMTRKLTSIM